MQSAEIYLIVLASSAVVLLAVVAVRAVSGAGMPTLLVFLGIGLVMGEAGLGLGFDDAQLTQTIGSFALAVILTEGGLTTRMSDVRPVAGPALTLATLGVAVTILLTAGLTYLMLDVDVRTAVLLGAVVGSTDAAAVFAVLRTLRIRRRIQAIVEVESGLNDPAVIILVVLVVSDAWFEQDASSILLSFVTQIVVGLAVGLVVALLARWTLERLALPSAGLYPLATFCFPLLAFGAAGAIEGSGFVAVYVAAVVLGNARLPHRSAVLGFSEGLAWLAQIGLFVLLGLLASPNRLLDALLPAVLVGLTLLLVARPLSVLICLTPFRFRLREQLFVSWAGLRGAVPIVLATFPITAGLDGANRIFDVTFVLVVVFTLLQGPTLPLVARLAGVAEPTRTRELDLENAPLDESGATVVSCDVPHGSLLQGVDIAELRLPGNAVVALVFRGESLFVPTGQTTLRSGDRFLVAVAEPERGQVEKRLRAVSRRGRLAHWFGEFGDDEAAVAGSN